VIGEGVRGVVVIALKEDSVLRTILRYQRACVSFESGRRLQLKLKPRLLTWGSESLSCTVSHKYTTLGP
jgi:hypothetical protein